MFKLAVFTDEVSQELATVIQVCRDYDLDGIEVRSVWDKPPQDLSDDDVARMKDMLGEASLEVCAIASPFFKCDLGNEEHYAEHIGILRRCCAIAHELGTDIVRGFTFWTNDDPISVWPDILANFDEPKRILADQGIRLGIENESSTMVGSARLCAKFLEDVQSDRIGAIWDACNEVYYNAEHGQPEDGAYAEGYDAPFPDAYRQVKDRIIHVHIKDAAGQPQARDAKVVRVGEGDIDFPAQFQALIDDGYQGYCSLETHWRPVELTKEQVDRPGGAAFSESGEMASRLCLDNIKQMLADLRV
ncbi:MAG: sugar phosphate isomerase/epimerase family protein [Armatimonadota bacterium]